MQICYLLVMAMAAFVLTGLIRRYALHQSLMDIPNERSSHSVPTPRGGGLSIVLAFLSGFLILVGLDALPMDSNLWNWLSAGGLVALLGFIDDHGHIPARWRLLGHFSAAAVALYWLGGLPALSYFGLPLDLGWLGHIGAALYLVWLLNLYNFMDGIDGIAAMEAITVSLGAVVLYWVGGWVELIWLPLMLAATVFGFMLWNFPKARIFMGDAGSGFVGMGLGLLSIQAAWADSGLFWAWLILLGSFIVDATVTLVRRLLRKERVYEAHRSHAYQYASRVLGTHPPVTWAVGAINLFWLLPVAVAVMQGWLNGTLGLLVAYLPLIWLTVHFKAGAREQQAV